MSLFKSFQPSKGDVSSSTAVKSSVQRAIRTKLLDQYPTSLGKDEGVLLESIWPKKEGVTMVKFSREHVTMLVLSGRPLFYQHFDGPYLPTLHLVHQYPHLLPHIQVDRGAIRFLLGGANIMAPGLLSSGGSLGSSEMDAGTPVIVMAQGKEEAVSIGVLKESTKEIREKGKGMVVDNVHYLGDDLWTVCAQGGL